MKYVMIYSNFKKININNIIDKIVKLLILNNIKVLMSNYTYNFYKNKHIQYLPFFKCIYCSEVIITIGGDGTILSIADIAAYNNKPILGINMGTLGFMTSLEISDIDNNLIKMINEKNIESRMLLQIKIYRNNIIIYNNLALNDIVIYKYNHLKTLNTNLYINNNYIFKFVSDGIIFSTPTGSTAYALSAGGPIIKSSMECISIIPICAHNSTIKSLILSYDDVITANTYSVDSKFCKVSTDGKYHFNILASDNIKIEKAQFKLKLLKSYKKNIFDDVNQKFLRRY